MNLMSKARGSLTGAVAMLTLGVGWCMVQLPILQDKADAAAGKVGRLEPQVSTLSDNQQKLLTGLAEANNRLVALGKAPVPVPKMAAPSPQPGALTAADVRQIVVDQLTRTPAKVTQAEITQIAKVAAALVPKPVDGKTPTPAELQTYAKVAVASYCLEGRCQGKPGESVRGEKGDPAPKVTDEELLKAAQTALAAYCGQETKPCQGMAGTNGKDAPPPYSVVDTDCVGDGEQSVWRVYLSNGTDQKSFTTRGPCRVGPDPD